MRIIGSFVAEEEVFEYVDNIRNNIRNEMISELPPGHPMRPVVPEDFGTSTQPIEFEN